MSIDRRMDKEDVVYIHNGILLSHEKNEIMPFAETWMDLEMITLSNVKSKKNKYYISLMQNLKFDISEIFTKQK